MSFNSGSQPLRRVFEPEVLLAFAVLCICVYYTFSYALLAPYPGVDWDAQWFVLRFDEGCLVDPNCANGRQDLQAGDRLIQIGGMTFDQYVANRRAVPFAGYRPGDTVPIKFIHAGRETEMRWPMLGPQGAARLVRLATLLFWMPFWLAGSVVLALLRPRNMRRLLLMLFNFLTALWIAVGLTSVARISGSAVLMRMLTWFMLPIYLYLHALMPTPLLPTRYRLAVPALFILACVLSVLEWLQILPASAFYLAALIAMLGSLALLIYRSYRRATDSERLVTRLMLAGILLGFGPGIALWTIPVLVGAPAPGPVLIAITTLAIPLQPLIYIYALYKQRLGSMEFRANRWLSFYSFILLFSTAFLTVFLVAGNWVNMTGRQLTFALVVSIIFISLALWLRMPFQRLFDRLAYGTEHNPGTVIRTFANEIPRALERQALAKLLTNEVLPALLIRQSALYTWSESELSVVYVDHAATYTQPDIMDQLRSCLEPAGRYIPPNADPAAKEVFDWVRLAMWIEVGGKRIALWLLGKRDPEDFYPLPDIDLLRTLGNQIGVALETARLVANLQRRAGELETAYRDLQKLDRLKDEFVQNVSHELRTPLTFLRGYADMLLGEMLGPINPQQREALLTVSDRTNGLIRLVNDIISMQHRQVEELVREPVNLIALARSCLKAVEVANRRREPTGPVFTFCLEGPEDAPPVPADRQRLAQVIDNLLSNAVKFSPNGGMITICIIACCYEPDEFSPEIRMRPGLMLAVEDHGIGIEPAQLDQIWERFYQVDGSSRRRFGGLGLGLAIARSIVVAHDGKIWAESEPGRGSTFKIILPTMPGDKPATLQCLDNSSTLC